MPPLFFFFGLFCLGCPVAAVPFFAVDFTLKADLIIKEDLMKTKLSLFALVIVVSLAVFALLEIVSFSNLLFGIPAAARVAAPFLFPLGALLCSPVYMRLAKHTSLDVKKFESESELVGSLEGCGKAPLLAMIVFFCAHAHPLFALLHHSIARL